MRAGRLGYMGKRNAMTEYYKTQLAKGLEYQDFVMINLHKHGIVLQNIQSRKYQLKTENLLGMEIKFDDKMKETGNLYFETYEKSDPENANYVMSGILRDDECWLFAIGNYEEIFIFSKNRLKKIWKMLEAGKEVLKARRVQISTSIGMLIPVSEANIICEKRIMFK